MIGKSFLPKSLFGRALLILVLPTVLIQVVVAYVFFERHWENVSRHLSGALAGEAAFLVRQLKAAPPRSKPGVVTDFEQATGIDVFLDAPEACEDRQGHTAFPEFAARLRTHIGEPVAVYRAEGGDRVEARILLPGQCLHLVASVKRLESRTTVIFLLWMLGASSLFLAVAVVFLRNQIRPIARLAEAADNFGRGVDMPGFRPHGAAEVRKAARAFVVMRERIKRQMRARTEMLAGISHDLRTPLTRMKLHLAMLDGEAAKDLGGDVQQMEHMIEEYLDFARGEGREETTKISLRDMLTDVVEDYRRTGGAVAMADGEDRVVALRLVGFRRMLHNVIDNALRYGKRCELSWRTGAAYCEILIDDDGPGIPEDKREEVFKPFVRLDPSRNVNTGGVGLGLSIARDIALAHGGGISLETSPMGGLRVVIRLPL